jgi:DNA-binding NarL/FixJ family response regulator
MRLLIVDDNEKMRRLLRVLVADLASAICECDDGAEALPSYVSFRPDWVLMDVELLRVDGLTATRQILAAFPDARVVIVTNYDDEDLRAEARAAGARGYVVKENLLEVRRLLQTA